MAKKLKYWQKYLRGVDGPSLKGPTDAKKKKSKVVLWILGALFVAAVVGGGYLLFIRKKRKPSDERKEEDYPESKPTPAPAPPSSGGSTYTPPIYNPRPAGDSFPIKSGSRGPRVRALQEAFIRKFGANSLPRFGADGDFGSETRNAFQSKGWPTSFDETNYNQYAGSSASSGEAASNSTLTDALSIAKELYAASWGFTDRFVTALKRIKNVADYSLVNERFKEQFWGTPQTIVVAGLSSYFSAEAKEKIRAEFVRIGLKYNQLTNTWWLSGLGAKTHWVKTRVRTTIWTPDNITLEVPAGVTIGREIRSGGGFTEVINGGSETFYCHTQDVAYA